VSRILIVDDDTDLLGLAAKQISEAGHKVDACSDPQEALDRLREVDYDLVLTDLEMPNHSGLDILRVAREIDTSQVVLLLTGHATIETAVEAMKLGAFDYLEKPFPFRDLQKVIEKGLRHRDLERENRQLRKQVRDKYRFENLVGNSPGMQEVFRLVERVAPTSSTALILGASGTGKELIARAIHENSTRSEERFLKINCSALSETLLESELFGHERGSFTGAVTMKRGLFEVADGGTLFLDEVGDTPLPLQAKLLRVLQEGEIRRVGGTEDISVDVRLIAATNQDLKRKIDEGNFRDDLFFRLNVVSIPIPPLRDRVDDIPLLVDHLVQKKASKSTPLPKISQQAQTAMEGYSWPGNVRELENAIERAIVLSEGDTIELGDLPEEISTNIPASTNDDEGCGDSGWQTLKELEKGHIARVLLSMNGKREEAAKLLGITRRTLYDKIKRYGLEERLP